MSENILYTEILELKKILENLSIQKKDYLNVEEASKYLSISKSSVYKLTSSKSIKHFKTNNKLLLFKKTDLSEYIENGKVDTKEDYNLLASSMVNDFLKQ